MLQGPTDAAEIQTAAAAFGLQVGPIEPDLCEVWAEHWPAVRLFGAMQTQWRHGLAGRTGLDYAALPAVERRLGLSARAARRAFEHLRVMESEALRLWAEQP